MKKTPLGENALLILMTHNTKHDTLKVHKNFILFSLDISNFSTYCKVGNSLIPSPACIATLRQGILSLTSEGKYNG